MRIAVRVHPRSSSDRIVRKGPDEYEIWVTAPATENRANEAAQEALAGYLGLAKSRVRLVQGARGRHKVFELA